MPSVVAALPLALLAPLSAAVVLSGAAAEPAQAPASGAATAPASPATAPPPLVLSDLSSAAEVGRFVRRGVDAAHFTPEPGGGARVVFVPYRPGAMEWPALILRTDRGLPADWGAYDALAADVTNDGNAEMDLAFYVEDAHGNKGGRHFAIAPGKTETIRLPLSELGTLDTGRVREMQFYTSRPPKRSTAVLRGLRLEADEALRRDAVERAVAGSRETFDRLERQARDPDVRRSLREDRGAAEALAARVPGAGRAEQARLRRELLAATAQAERSVPRRLSEARLRREFARLSPKSPYAVGFATGMEKVFPADLPFAARVARSASLALAGNETESLQVLVLAGAQELRDVRVSVGPLTRKGGRREAAAATPAPSVRVSPVGFVKTKQPGYKVGYVGWHPDPILDFLDRVTVKAGEMQPVWVRVEAPKGTPAGDYSGVITVSPANAPPVTLDLTVTVWDFDLPDETHLRTAVSFREPMIEKVHGAVNGGAAMRDRYYDFLLKYRINPDDIFRTSPPAVSDLERWAERGMNAFNLTYVVRPKDLKPNAPYPEERKREILAQLDAIVPQLKARGLYDKAYVYGFDEVHADSFAAMNDVFGAIKAKYPDLLILTTAYDDTYGKRSGLPASVVDGWVPLTPKFDPGRVAAARTEGKQVWWYTCIVPQAPYANWFVEYDAVDARSLMGLQTAKYRPDGFLYYAVNRWPLSKKPITSGPYTDWPAASFDTANGDGSFVCAGPDGPLSTIRLENIRDGLEDNEYFWLLDEEIKKLRASRRPGAVEALRRAERARTIGDDLVKDLTHFSKSPEEIYRKRREVAEAILDARTASQGAKG